MDNLETESTENKNIEYSGRYAQYNVSCFLKYYSIALSRAINRENLRIEKIRNTEVSLESLFKDDSSKIIGEEFVHDSFEDDIVEAISIKSEAKTYFAYGYAFTVHGHKLTISLDSLKPALRYTVLLSFFTELNDREIGEKMGVSRNTVINRRVEGLKRMRKVMEAIK